MGLKKRRIKRHSKEEAARLMSKSRKNLPCEDCGRLMKGLQADVKAITCAYCMARKCPWEKKDTNKEKHPRGWHRRKLYISESGTPYSYGKEVSKDEADRLFEEVSASDTHKTPKKSPEDIDGGDGGGE